MVRKTIYPTSVVMDQVIDHFIHPKNRVSPGPMPTKAYRRWLDWVLVRAKHVEVLLENQAV